MTQIEQNHLELDFNETSERFFTIRTSDKKTVEAIKNNRSSVEIDGLNGLKNELKKGDIIFLVFGGDAAKVDWDRGFAGIGKLSREPYECSRENEKEKSREYFKVQIDVKFLFSKPIPKMALQWYPSTFDVQNIGPILTWVQNQALSKVDPDKAYAVLNAILDIDKTVEQEYEKIFSPEQMKKIKGDFGKFVLQNEKKYGSYVIDICQSRDFKADNFCRDFDCGKRYINSLIAKPFVILTGNSGTGKTQVAKQFAEYLKKGDDELAENYLFIPVGADWTDNTKILGYYNPLANNGVGKYEKTEVFRFIERAIVNPDIPFFLILDEMNLSHVERYFSDFLSKMELLNYSTSEKVFFDITGYGKLELPKNLFITGTVNIDETTYMFSPKVLDRANVIEFKPEMNDILQNLLGESSYNEIGVAEDGVAEGFMQLANKIRSEKVPQEVEQTLGEIQSILKKFYETLEKYGFEFAYRTVKEIRLYAIAAYETANESKPSAHEIADIQILQKILPKIHGNKKQIGELLDKLDQLCETESLPLSRKKIIQMKDKLNRFQYASFI